MVNIVSSDKIKYQLKIPSKTDNLELIRLFVSTVADKVGFNPDEVSKIELAVDEGCANVIKHAYKKDSKRSIDLVIEIDYKKFTITGFSLCLKKPRFRRSPALLIVSSIEDMCLL